MTVRAFAKLNLTLEVLGPRPDGYHDLRSVVVPVSLADDIEITPARDVTVEMAPPPPNAAPSPLDAAPPPPNAAPPPPNAAPPFQMAELCSANPPANPPANIALSAAALMRRLAGPAAGGAAIRIAKRIPMGGGLGGGSADAAAVMRALAAMWRLPISPAALAAAGAEIGSDVPALVLGGAVLMEGRGERVAPLAAAPGFALHAVLAFPGVHSSTAEIFSLFGATRLPERPEILYNMRRAMLDGDAAAIAAAIRNDLEETARRRHPEIGRAADALRAAGCLGVSMSGSGSTVFGIARGAGDARRVAGELSRRGIRAAAVETVR